MKKHRYGLCFLMDRIISLHSLHLHHQRAMVLGISGIPGWLPIVKIIVVHVRISITGIEEEMRLERK